MKHYLIHESTVKYRVLVLWGALDKEVVVLLELVVAGEVGHLDAAAHTQLCCQGVFSAHSQGHGPE